MQNYIGKLVGTSVMLFWALCTFGLYAEDMPLGVPVKEYTLDEIYSKLASRLMKEKGISTGRDKSVCDNWTIPRKFSQMGNVYTIVGSSDVFSVFNEKEPTNQLASGSVRIFKNEAECRNNLFSQKVCGSQPWEAVGWSVDAKQVSKDVVIASHAPDSNTHYRRHNLLYKNINIEIHAPSNGVEFAKAILEAGLKNGAHKPNERERKDNGKDN